VRNSFAVDSDTQRSRRRPDDSSAYFDLSRRRSAPSSDGRTRRSVQDGASDQSINQSINQSCTFRVVQVIKSLQNPLEVGNNLPAINDNVRERGMEQKCF